MAFLILSWLKFVGVFFFSFVLVTADVKYKQKNWGSESFLQMKSMYLLPDDSEFLIFWTLEYLCWLIETSCFYQIKLIPGMNCRVSLNWDTLPWNLLISQLNLRHKLSSFFKFEEFKFFFSENQIWTLQCFLKTLMFKISGTAMKLHFTDFLMIQGWISLFQNSIFEFILIIHWQLESKNV